MRQRHARHSLDFGYPEYTKICLPLVKSIQRIMIGAQVLRQILAANRSPEHPAQRYSIHDAAIDAKADKSPRKLVHHNENPICSQGSDSHRNKSQLHKLSLAWPRKVSQEG